MGDELQITDELTGTVLHEIQQIPAMRPATARERIEEERLLAVLLSKAGRQRPILLLDVHAHDRPAPGEQIGDDHSDAFARARLGRQRHALLPREAHELASEGAYATDPAEDDTLTLQQSRGGHFSPGGKARVAMQRRSPRANCCQSARHDERQSDGGAQEESAPNLQPIPVVVGITQDGERCSASTLGSQRPQEQEPREVLREDQGGPARERDLDE